jgi:hypothetical protein
MTPRGPRCSENEQVIWVCLLFPLFWPFLPVILACLGIEKLRDVYWTWSYRRRARREDAMNRTKLRID